MQAEIQQFINWVRMRSPQARTWRDYRCDLDLFAAIVGEKNIEEIQPRDIDEFVNYQIGKGYKPSTVNRRLAAVASFYVFLKRDGRQIISPVLPRRHYLKEPQRLPRPVNEKDLHVFFGAIHDIRDRAMCTLMLRCGLRIGEVAELKKPDLYLGESPSRLIIHGKGSTERTVYVSPDAERDLNNWLASRPKVSCEHVFISYQQKKISTTSISKRIHMLCEQSGVKLTAHRLRHTFADNLLSAGMPITSIQKLMGHRFVETTQNYATANDKRVEADFYAACEKIEGWKLLIEAAQANGPEKEAASVYEWDYASEEESGPETNVRIQIPASASCLTEELVQQLEAYRQLKANRWRVERVAANSYHFFGMHVAMWKYFAEHCTVKTVSELHQEHVLKYVQFRLDQKRSPKTVNGALSALHSFLLFLREDGMTVHPSLENIQRLKEPVTLPRYMTSEQVQCLRTVIESEAAKEGKYDALLVRSVFYLLWQGGLRSGEVDGLRFSDFYISQANHAKRLFVRDGKWRNGRAVYLTDVALGALQAYLAVRGTEKAGGFVFVRNGSPLKRHYLPQRLKTLGRQADVTVSPHRLRHTFATQLLNVGCQVTSIQKLLGHTNLNTTMTYARAFDQTVMLDYFRALDTLENQPDGAWSGLDPKQGSAQNKNGL
jgi:site-specific recombinase XerD